MSPLENATKTAEGVVVKGFVLSPVVEQCSGCDRVREFDGEQFCSSYPNPASAPPRAARRYWLFLPLAAPTFALSSSHVPKEYTPVGQNSVSLPATKKSQISPCRAEIF